MPFNSAPADPGKCERLTLMKIKYNGRNVPQDKRQMAEFILCPTEPLTDPVRASFGRMVTNLERNGLIVRCRLRGWAITEAGENRLEYITYLASKRQEERVLSKSAPVYGMDYSTSRMSGMAVAGRTSRRR